MRMSLGPISPLLLAEVRASRPYSCRSRGRVRTHFVLKIFHSGPPTCRKEVGEEEGGGRGGGGGGGGGDSSACRKEVGEEEGGGRGGGGIKATNLHTSGEVRQSFAR